MAELRIYLNERIHTGQLRDAGHEALHNDRRVVQLLKEKVDGYNPALEPFPEPIFMRLVIGRHSVPDDLQQRWKKAEVSLTMLMVEAGILSYPTKVWSGLFKKFQYAQDLPNKKQVLGFLNLSGARLQALASKRTQERLDTLRWSGLVYVENMMLRGAIFGSTFFIPPERPVLN